MTLPGVPCISRFYGIAIYMYFRDHEPPHVHVKYGGAKATIAIRSLRVRKGSLPPRALALVRRWAILNRDALEADWKRAQHGRPLRPIAPLD